ncbi:hypothetical protein ACJZ2D_010716 [Fusarium nematophilum]
MASAGTQVEPVFERSISPVHTFASQAEYAWRHEQGTLIEMQNEEEVLKRFNDKRTLFQSWPIAHFPDLTTSFKKSWLLLVVIPKLSDDIIFPGLSDRFTIDMENSVETRDGTYTLVHLHASRIQNPYGDMDNLPCQAAAKCAAFQVDVPRSWQNKDGDHTELDLMAFMQIASGIEDFSSLTLDETTRQNITIMWDTSSNTFEAELAALRRFTEQSRLEERQVSLKQRLAFESIQNFGAGPKLMYNLLDMLPHLKDLTNPHYRIPKLLLAKFGSFNADHRAAYDGLAEIPNGLYFVNGCPGAGKTEWNMVVSALIQSQKRPGSKKRCSPILFLVDLNKTVDDAADRYFSLCKAAGINRRIIRMHGWPYEMRHSAKLNASSPHQSDSDSAQEPDFTQKFLVTASITQHTQVERSPNKAPTLDEAAWDYYKTHKHDCFTTIRRVLDSMKAGEVLTTADWKALRGQVAMLYRAVLRQTDFIATTPVAAYGSFSKLFKPEVVFVDEAPHARELTSLIPISFFEPIAWIFTGDVKQTRPFVKSGDRRDALKHGLKFNPHAEQLRLSLMARADMAGAINSKLLVNKRAHGNLHRLPSILFYHGQMSSGYQEAERYPPSVRYLKSYLEQIGHAKNLEENRAVIALKQSEEQNQRNSFWNPTHHNWVMEQVVRLLQDPKFRSVTDVKQTGTIMIQTPYGAAMRQYMSEAKQWPAEWRDRVEIMTVDKAQGNQADVVFLDMVRTTKAGFMNEPQRLNVALTRARQAEVILMHHQMTWRASRGRAVRAEYTSKVWDDALANGRLFVL